MQFMSSHDVFNSLTQAHAHSHTLTGAASVAADTPTGRIDDRFVRIATYECAAAMGVAAGGAR